MRKLHELLPIARSYLATIENAGTAPGLCLYTCFAAEKAQEAGEMRYEEVDALKTAIIMEMSHQRGRYCFALASLAQERGVSDWARSREYIEFRDAWLDEFQAKLVRENR